MAKAKSAHLESLISSVDQLLFAGFVVSYILDGNLLGLVVKCISQLQFSAPKTHHPDRSLRFHMTACGLVNGIAMLYHFAVPPSKNPRGIIIDFIGQSYIPTKLQLFAMDIAITLLQALLVILAYETGHYGDEADFDDDNNELLGSAFEAEHREVEETSTIARDDEVHEDVDHGLHKAPELPTSREPHVINLRLRHTLHRVLHNKPLSVGQPVSVSPSAPGSASGTPTSEGTALTRLNRMRARIRQRAREMGVSVPSEVPDRIDEGSDEEREAGLPLENTR